MPPVTTTSCGRPESGFLQNFALGNRLGQPRSTTGTVNVDVVYERQRDRNPRFDGAEQCTAFVDVQDASLYWVVVAWAPSMAWVVDYGNQIGDPREPEVWQAAASAIAEAPGPVPVSITGVDSGYLPQVVTRECSRRRGWIGTV